MEPVQTASPTPQFRQARPAVVFQKHFQPPRFQALHRPQTGAVVYRTGMCQGDIPPEYHISSTEKMTAPLTHNVRAKLQGAWSQNICILTPLKKCR